MLSSSENPAGLSDAASSVTGAIFDFGDWSRTTIRAQLSQSLNEVFRKQPVSYWVTLLNEAGVACLNGGAFGEYGKGYIRFSYANSLENLMEAVERIRKVAVRWEPVAAAQR